MQTLMEAELGDMLLEEKSFIQVQILMDIILMEKDGLENLISLDMIQVDILELGIQQAES